MIKRILAILVIVLAPTLVGAQACLTRGAGSVGDPCTGSGCDSGISSGPTNCADDCTTCGSNATVSITVDEAKCDSRSTCNTDPSNRCAKFDDVIGSATVSLTGTCSPSSRDLVICEAWVDCTNDEAICTRCTDHSMTPGNDWVGSDLVCATAGEASYAYRITVNDVTGDTGDCRECVDSETCPAANCEVNNCHQKARAGSCCMLYET